MYRGQSDSEWTLIPSALRSKIRTSRRMKIKDYENALKEEFSVLKDFITHPSFELPKGLPGIDKRKIFHDVNINTFFKYPENLLHWPIEPYDAFSAFVQHQKTKTSLLDWTSRSYVAIFFAAIGHLDVDPALKETKIIAVWIYLHHENTRIKIFEPLSTEQNIKAQFGKFSSVSQEIDFSDEIRYETLDSLLDKSRLFKITIDKNFSPNLLQYCKNHFIDYASMYPTNKDSITKANEDEKKIIEIMKTNQKEYVFLDPTSDALDTI
ncbi:FRG domain-containing protein [Leptospira wolbachii]|nr:FRG domain-containing protein [Leptospira wolbachii]